MVANSDREELDGRSLVARFRRIPAWMALLVGGITVAYLGTMALTTGLHGEQLLVCGLLLIAVVWSDRTRDFFLRTLPLTFYGIIYDLTHITEPLVRKLHVHVAEPYRFELSHFGLHTSAGTVLTINQYFALHHWAWLDLLTGTAYLVFLYAALIFGFYLVWTGRSGPRRRLATGFTWAFLAMNVAGFATYYLYPAAPPWYVAQWGLGPANFAAQASPAAAIRWDQLVGLHYFERFYGRSADIFGAIPSLHAAQPLLVFLIARHLGSRALSWTTGLYYLLVCFSALYLQHHYLLDVLIGSAYALLAYTAERAIARWISVRERHAEILPSPVHVHVFSPPRLISK
jgi:multisubunit Na+/H+ antiporter MnhF subunit